MELDYFLFQHRRQRRRRRTIVNNQKRSNSNGSSVIHWRISIHISTIYRSSHCLFLLSSIHSFIDTILITLISVRLYIWVRQCVLYCVLSQQQHNPLQMDSENSARWILLRRLLLLYECGCCRHNRNRSPYAVSARRTTLPTILYKLSYQNIVNANQHNLVLNALSTES